MSDKSTDQARKLIARRSQEWHEFSVRWRWLADSYEGGDRYRWASYGTDGRGLPIMNLVRHKREYPDQSEAAVLSTYGPGTANESARLNGGITPSSSDDDFSARVSRTPIPGFTREAVDGHLAQIYSREVVRTAPETVTEWWKDVDGQGTSMDAWFQDTIAPLMLTLGQIDLFFDRPAAPRGSQIQTKADEGHLGIDRCIASYILPENMLWWKLSKYGAYEECLVRENCESLEGECYYRFRYWTDEGWVLFSDDGEVVDQATHEYGCVPIIRVFDRKLARCSNSGDPRYGEIAEYQREYYNRDSELILSDSTQAHPLLQGPEDYVQADGTVPIGPSWLLPKKKSSGTSVSYEGFEVIEFPKDGAASIRLNKGDIREQVDRVSHQVKPAGSSGTSKGTVEQSGISKSIDYKPAHAQLAKIAKALSIAETKATKMAMIVLGIKPGKESKFEIVYPTNFDLYGASDVAVALSDFQNIASRTGIGLPQAEIAMLSRLWRLCMPGLTDEIYAAADREIQIFIKGGGGVQHDIDMAALTTGTPGGSVTADVSDPTTTLQPAGKGGGNPSGKNIRE